jgi:hypothetical protein
MLVTILAAATLQTEIAKPPKQAVILFNGKDSAAWVQDDGSPCKWNVVDGVLEVNTSVGSIRTKEEFGDYKLHIEFWLPRLPSAKGQNRANSGCYQHGRYEIQILDSFQNPTYKFGGVGALYAQKDPGLTAR